MKKGTTPEKQRNRLLALTGIAFQMGITIYLFVFLGKWLDEKFPQDFRLYTMVFTILGVAISLYAINKQLQRLN